jgi:hypothetical protein
MKEVELLRATVYVVSNLKKNTITGTIKQPPLIPAKLARPSRKASRVNPIHSVGSRGHRGFCVQTPSLHTWYPFSPLTPQSLATTHLFSESKTCGLLSIASRSLYSASCSLNPLSWAVPKRITNPPRKNSFYYITYICLFN